MNPVRNIFNDLVDRRLWPVALALVAALVAVPILLGGSSSSSPAAAPAQLAQTPATGGTAQAAISVSQVPTTRVDRAGSVRNPFVQHKVKDPSTTTTNPTTTTTPTSTSLTNTPISSGGGTALSPVSSGPTTTFTPVPGTGGVKPQTSVQDVYRVNLRFGAAGNQKVRHDIPRLTPLPSMSNPFFVFLGVLADHKTAVFLVSSDATATGDGTCKPNPTECDTVELKAGDTEFFDVAQGNAGSTQYELDLLKVSHGTVKGTAAAAAKAARRVSSGGKTVVHELKAEGDKSMGRYIYSYKRGILVRRHGARAAVSATASSTGFTPAHSSGVLGTSWGP